MRTQLLDASLSTQLSDTLRVLQEYLDKLIVECDRKIQRASKRLEEDDADAKTYSPISKVIRTDETDAISVVLKEKTDRLNDDCAPPPIPSAENRVLFLNAVKLKHRFGESGGNWQNLSRPHQPTSRSLPLSPSAPHHV